MTTSLIPRSHDLVRLTREAWNLNKANFGKKIGVTGEFAGRVEHGLQTFSDRNIADGCVHADPDVRAFWQAYRSARRHELDTAIIENCINPPAVQLS